MRNGPTEFCPCDGPSSAQLRPRWEALHDKVDNLWRPESQVSQHSMGTIAEAQCTYCRHSAKARADTLLASLHGGTEDIKRALARLLMIKCQLLLPPRISLAGYPPAELKRVQDCPPTPPRPRHPAPRCPHRAVRLRSQTTPHGHRPWHAMLRPGCTVYAAP
jgi:hypothetical protein